MPELPQKLYLRRGVVRDYFGITDEEFTELVRAGVLTPHYLRGRGRAFYKRAEVLKAEADNKLFKPSKETKR
jgi:hypothetical protein